MTHENFWSRRQFLAVAAGAAGAAALGPLGCGQDPIDTSGGSARLQARPGTPTMSITPGTWPLGLGTETYDGLLLVPSSYVHGTSMPLALALHGAGTRADAPIAFLQSYAESRGFLVLSVDSVGLTWDAITFRYLSDVAFIDRALAHAFERCSVDPARVAVQGFSDGASYALGLGLANGDLFKRVVAHSPGFIPPFDDPTRGEPEFFFSHGTQDPILRVDTTSRRLVADLRAGGFTVEYHEFAGGHEIPPSIAALAADWLVR
jgi:phospholipase/carboxylesterase